MSAGDFAETADIATTDQGSDVRDPTSRIKSPGRYRIESVRLERHGAWLAHRAFCRTDRPGARGADSFVKIIDVQADGECRDPMGAHRSVEPGDRDDSTLNC